VGAGESIGAPFVSVAKSIGLLCIIITLKNGLRVIVEKDVGMSLLAQFSTFIWLAL